MPSRRKSEANDRYASMHDWNDHADLVDSNYADHYLFDEAPKKSNRLRRILSLGLLGLVGVSAAIGIYLHEDVEQNQGPKDTPHKPSTPGLPDHDPTKTVADAFTPKPDGTAYLATPELAVVRPTTETLTPATSPTAIPEATPDPSQIHLRPYDERVQNDPNLPPEVAQWLLFTPEDAVIGVMLSPESGQFSEKDVHRAARLLYFWQEYTKNPVDPITLVDKLLRFSDLTDADRTFIASLLFPNQLLSFGGDAGVGEEVPPEVEALVRELIAKGGTRPLQINFFADTIVVTVDREQEEFDGHTPTPAHTLTEAANALFPEKVVGGVRVYSAEEIGANGFYTFDSVEDDHRKVIVAVAAESTNEARGVLSPALTAFQRISRAIEKNPAWQPGITNEVVISDLRSYLIGNAESSGWSQGFVNFLCAYFSLEPFEASPRAITDPHFDNAETNFDAIRQVVDLLVVSGEKLDQAWGITNFGEFAAVITSQASSEQQ